MSLAWPVQGGPVHGQHPSIPAPLAARPPRSWSRVEDRGMGPSFAAPGIFLSPFLPTHAASQYLGNPTRRASHCPCTWCTSKLVVPHLRRAGTVHSGEQVTCATREHSRYLWHCTVFIVHPVLDLAALNTTRRKCILCTNRHEYKTAYDGFNVSARLFLLDTV